MVQVPYNYICPYCILQGYGQTLVHSHKILKKQQGFNSGSLAYLLDIPCEVCKGLTKCGGSEVHLVVSSKFYESVLTMFGVAHGQIYMEVALHSLLTLYMLYKIT